MAVALQPVRGTHDILADEARLRRYIFDKAMKIAECYGFGEIATPIFEFTDVFSRTLGETSDVVNKEMYTFEDRGGESITLRPEFTAGIVRAFLSNGLQQHLPLKCITHGPVFRYERPQKGRMRQFHQVDMEILGIADPRADVEIISIAAQFLAALGLSDYVTLELNSLGDYDSRVRYREMLVEYFIAHKDKLSDDSKLRLEKNPLRILDSKDEGDRVIVKEAPSIEEAFNEESKLFLATVTESLESLGIAYKLNRRLVRGLDYYCHTVFEFTTDKLGAQGTVLAGGRYDGLVQQMGGSPTPATGWGAGIERLTALVQDLALAEVPAAPASVVVIPSGASVDKEAFLLAESLRRAGMVIDFGYSGNMKKRLNRADKNGAVAVVIVGEEEWSRGEVVVKHLATGEQKTVNKEELASYIATSFRGFGQESKS